MTRVKQKSTGGECPDTETANSNGTEGHLSETEQEERQVVTSRYVPVVEWDLEEPSISITTRL